VEAILISIGLRLSEQSFLGYPIRSVRLFGIPIPQVIFLEWHRRKFGVGADGPNLDELLNLVDPRGLHQLDSHHQILVKESSGILAIGPDAAHNGGQMNNHLRFHFAVEPFDIFAAHEIILVPPHDDDIVASLLAKPRNDSTPQEASAARNADSLSFE